MPIIGSGTKTITDLNDYSSVPITSAEAPSDPVLDQMWLDVSDPNAPTGKRWNGTAWVIEDTNSTQWSGVLAQWQNSLTVRNFAAQIELLENEGIQALVRGDIYSALGLDDDATTTLQAAVQILLQTVRSEVSESVNGVAQRVTTVEQTAGRVSTAIADYNIGLVTHFEETSAGLAIRNSTSNYNVLLANDGLYLRNGTTNVAWFAASSLLNTTVMKIATAQVRDELNIGHLRIRSTPGTGVVTVGYNSAWESI